MLSFNERDLVDYCAANLAVDSQPIRRWFLWETYSNGELPSRCESTQSQSKFNWTPKAS